MEANVNSLVFTFDSVFDTGLGYMCYIWDNYTEPQYTKYFNPYMYESAYTTKNYLAAIESTNPLDLLFNIGEGENKYTREETASLYKYLQEKQYEGCVAFMPPNDIFKLCQTYNISTQESGIRTYIVCTNDIQEEKIKKLVDNQKIIRIDKIEDLDMTKYDSLYVRYGSTINENYKKIKHLEGKTIYVENYRFNYNDEGKLNINPEVAKANIIKIIEPYKDVNLVFGRKVEV